MRNFSLDLTTDKIGILSFWELNEQTSLLFAHYFSVGCANRTPNSTNQEKAILYPVTKVHEINRRIFAL